MTAGVYCKSLAGLDNGPGVMYFGAGCNLYPAVTQSNISGPVYTPRVYAYGLDTLELASSGRLSLTVSDVHVMDLTHTDGLTTLGVVRDADTFNIGALSLSRVAGVSQVSTAVPSDALTIHAATIALTGASISLASALTVSLGADNLGATESVIAANENLVLSAPMVGLAGAISVSRYAGGAFVSSAASADSLTIHAANVSLTGASVSLASAVTVSLGADSQGVSQSIIATSTGDNLLLTAPLVGLAGALSVSRGAGGTLLSTNIPGDTLTMKCEALQLNAGVINADGRINVVGTMGVTGGFDALSSAAGVITVGTLATDLGGISIGDSRTSSNSFLWHGESDANHWELIGGDLRVTRVRSDVPLHRIVSYTIRIADDDALEIHQSTSNSSGPSSHRRVARFGGC